MSPVDQKGRYYEDEESRTDAAVSSAARTTSGASSTFNVEGATAFECTLAVTAASGTTPTLDVKLQTSIDGGSTWEDVESFTQKTTTGSEGKVMSGLGDVCKWVWTIGGTTPSFTFTIGVDAQREH